MDEDEEAFEDEDFYNVDHPRRGPCIVFADEIAGYEKNISNHISRIRHAFEGLAFEVVVHLNLDAKEQEEWLRRSTTDKSNADVDCIACWFLTFPSATAVSETKVLPLPEVSRLFCREAAPLLDGKPKLFFIQTFTGEGDVAGVRQHSNRNIPSFPDFLYCFFEQVATPHTSGAAPNVFPFVEILCDVLENCVTVAPLHDVVFLVDVAMARIAHAAQKGANATSEDKDTSSRERGVSFNVPYYLNTLTRKLMLNKC